MQVGTLAIQHIFEKDVIYLVPLYQRPYVWTEAEQWLPLWEDLGRLAEAILAGKQPRAHFLGASVQDRPAVPPGQIETRLVIDGQQRLTTIQLFLKAFLDVTDGADEQRYHRAIDKLIHNNHPLSTKDYESFKVWPTNADREDFQTVMESESRTLLLKSYDASGQTNSVGRNIPDAYLFFHRAIAGWLSEAEGAPRAEKIAALYSAIRDNVRLVVIDLDEKDDAQLIFETLNARGTPLLASDLVKNSLLNEIQNAGQNAESAYQKFWQQFDGDSAFWRAKIGRGHAARARIEVFLLHALTLLTGEDVSAGHLYTAYRDFTVKTNAGSALSRLEAFKKYGDIYKSLQQGHHIPRVQQFLDRLATMDVGTAYPFLLKLFDILKGHDETLVCVLIDLESFLVRRMICRLSTRGYNRVFADLVSTLDSPAGGIPLRVQRAFISGKAEVDRWPSDDEFRKAWIANPLYENLTRPRLRMLLEAIESGLRHKFAETASVPKNMTIEHIMPQDWDMFWPLPQEQNKSDATLTRNRLIHTIGNLTLLNEKLNPSQSNKPWTDGNEPDQGKREALKAYSVLYLNKHLCDYAMWDETTIGTRSETLFELALTLWPRITL